MEVGLETRLGVRGKGGAAVSGRWWFLSARLSRPAAPGAGGSHEGGLGYRGLQAVPVRLVRCLGKVARLSAEYGLA